MPEKKRTFEADVNSHGRLRVKPDLADRVVADLRVCPEKAGVVEDVQVNGFSRETILRLIEWIKQV